MAALKLIRLPVGSSLQVAIASRDGGDARPRAALKLTKLCGRPPVLISSSNGAARFHCPPTTRAEMAALKQIN
eukprot:8197647-Karenia_brevis.AAC.1